MSEPRFICPCAQEDYERDPLATRRFLVPTSANCPEHNQFHPNHKPFRWSAAVPESSDDAA